MPGYTPLVKLRLARSFMDAAKMHEDEEEDEKAEDEEEEDFDDDTDDEDDEDDEDNAALYKKAFGDKNG